MFPYFELLWLKVYMTGIWIVVFLMSFIVVAKYLCYKWHQDFFKFFYWLPIAIIITYLMWSYFQFFLDVAIIPTSWYDLKLLISPYWYKLHFVGIITWFVLSLYLFFRKIKRYENKKIWADIIFFSLSLSLIPLWIFLIFGDNFIWKPNSWFLSLKPLTTQSELNKFSWVYPIWAFLSIMAALVSVIVYFVKKNKKRFWEWLIGFVYLIIWLNIIFMFQQHPRYGIMSFWWLVFDIKQYISFFVIMFCFHIYYKWQNKMKEQV